jgi:C-terminal processing protease CtpA/Prc
MSCSSKTNILSNKSNQINPTISALKKIVNYTRENSLYRNTVNWDTLSQQIFELALDSKSIPETSTALNYMLESLKDEHGRIYYNNQLIANYYGQPKEHQKSVEYEVYKKIQLDKEYEFHSQMLDNNIGYLRLVFLEMGDDENKAREIQDKLCELSLKGANSWVIDLRYNGGGNLSPMAEGIASVIGNGVVGGAKGILEEENMIWKIIDGDFYLGNNSINLKNDCKPNMNSKVAVLVSSYTASSGEALAVILKGRDNTRFFGNKTFGYVTGTYYHNMNDSIAINISTNFYQDRDGNVYDKYVDVDETIEFVKEPLSKEDNAVNSAINWIQEIETDDNKR